MFLPATPSNQQTSMSPSDLALCIFILCVSQNKNYSSHRNLIIFTSTKAVMFCLRFVCVSLSRITQKGPCIFHQTCQRGGAWAKEDHAQFLGLILFQHSLCVTLDVMDVCTLQVHFQLFVVSCCCCCAGSTKKNSRCLLPFFHLIIDKTLQLLKLPVLSLSPKCISS